MSLLEQGVPAGKLTRRSFRLPAGSVSGEHRIPLEIGVAGVEPVSLHRLDVEGIVVPMVGAALDQGEGGPKVGSVLKGSPAEKAGLKGGDVVIGIDGKRVSTLREAMGRLGPAKIGQEIRFEIRRGRQSKTVLVKPE